MHYSWIGHGPHGRGAAFSLHCSPRPCSLSGLGFPSLSFSGPYLSAAGLLRFAFLASSPVSGSLSTPSANSLLAATAVGSGCDACSSPGVVSGSLPASSPPVSCCSTRPARLHRRLRALQARLKRTPEDFGFGGAASRLSTAVTPRALTGGLGGAGRNADMAPCSPRGAGPGARVLQTTSQLAPAQLQPPVPKKVPHKMELFGDVRVDNYYWLRDDKRQDPEVLAYLAAENEYTASQMADTNDLQELLYQEMRGRIKEEDFSVPLRRGPYFYYTKTHEGKQYKVHCRRAIPGGEGPGTVDEVVDIASDTTLEEVLLDENEKALEHEFYSVGNVQVSPNHKLYAFLEDTTGGEIYTLRIVDIDSKAFIGDALTVRATEYLEWVDNETVLYITQDDVNRPCKVWSHKVGTEQSKDVLLYFEDNVEFFLDIYSSESREYIFVVSGSKTTSFNQYLATRDPNSGLKPLLPKVEGVDHTVTHRGGHFFVTRRSDEFFNSELLVCPVDNVTDTRVILQHRPSVKLQAVQAYENHLIIYERENGLQTITVHALPPAGEPIDSLSEGKRIVFPEPAYSVYPRVSQYKSHIARYGYSSLRTPNSVYDYDLVEHRSVLKKTEAVLGGFDITKYETERKWATASDGVQIPISLVYRKDLVKLDGTDPLLLYGYGAYELARDASFDGTRLELLDRGVVYAIAHIRGGGEMGRRWYEDGKLLRKQNTFLDFISCAEYLLDNKYGAKDKICIQGRSAGGLLIGGVLSLRPDLFSAAVAEVAFVDLITTMLDASIPLTTAEYEEWGNPNVEEYYKYMKSYSPVDNVKPRNYPNILVTGGLHDPRVGYWEPAKYVAKLRELKTDSNLLLLKCDLGSGHFSKSGRFDRLKEVAFVHAFMLKCFGLLPGSNSKV